VFWGKIRAQVRGNWVDLLKKEAGRLEKKREKAAAQKEKKKSVLHGQKKTFNIQENGASLSQTTDEMHNRGGKSDWVKALGGRQDRRPQGVGC